MTLLIAVLAAVFSTLAWYLTSGKRELKLGFLSLMLWGASLMWLVDAVFEYIELGAEFFTPAPAEMLNDLFLGLSAVALALVIWIVVLLFKDPEGAVSRKLFKK